jgi:hypothetical protein
MDKDKNNCVAKSKRGRLLVWLGSVLREHMTRVSISGIQNSHMRISATPSGDYHG